LQRSRASTRSASASPLAPCQAAHRRDGDPAAAPAMRGFRRIAPSAGPRRANGDAGGAAAPRPADGDRLARGEQTRDTSTAVGAAELPDRKQNKQAGDLPRRETGKPARRRAPASGRRSRRRANEEEQAAGHARAFADEISAFSLARSTRRLRRWTPQPRKRPVMTNPACCRRADPQDFRRLVDTSRCRRQGSPTPSSSPRTACNDTPEGCGGLRTRSPRGQRDISLGKKHPTRSARQDATR